MPFPGSNTPHTETYRELCSSRGLHVPSPRVLLPGLLVPQGQPKPPPKQGWAELGGQEPGGTRGLRGSESLLLQPLLGTGKQEVGARLRSARACLGLLQGKLEAGRKQLFLLPLVLQAGSTEACEGLLSFVPSANAPLSPIHPNQHGASAGVCPLSPKCASRLGGPRRWTG